MIIALVFALQVTPSVPPPAPGPASATAERVAPGVIPVTGDAYGPAITTDGRTMYFTLRANRRGQENIVVTRYDSVAGAWSAPRVASFSGGGTDKEPYLSPDGLRLYFASTRFYAGKDTAGGGEERFDLFVVERTGDEWGLPRPVAAANSPAYDNYPAVTANGTLYFASHRLAGRRNDLFVARSVHGRLEAPSPLARLNTEATEADPFIAPDESFLVFSSDRPGGAGQGDLYVSVRRNGAWAAPASLGPLVNTPDYEYTPFITADGRWLYFSRGWGEIWRIPVSALPALASR